MSIGSGTAREVPPGRLAAFEDAADDELTLERPSLPPRRRRISPAPEVPADASEAPALETRTLQRETPAQPAVSPPATTAAPRGRATVAKGVEDRVRPSNVHIPVELRDPIKAKCDSEGMSAGDVIIVAIEDAYPQLRELIRPAASAGGQLFASRRSHAPRTASNGPRTPLNYRMRQGDFDTLDRLVEEFDAKSRGDLITTALTYYFRDQLT